MFIPRQIETIPEYEPDTVPDQLQKNNPSRPSSAAELIATGNKTMIKRPGKQTVQSSEQVTIEKNPLTGKQNIVSKRKAIEE